MTRDSVAPPPFDTAFREQLATLFRWRRDVRHFRSDPLPADMLDALLETASLAPSVGLSQPWHFVTVDDPLRRAQVRACFAEANRDALAAQTPDRAERYARLKLAGLGSPITGKAGVGVEESTFTRTRLDMVTVAPLLLYACMNRVF